MRSLRALIVLAVLVGFPAAALASTPASQSVKRALMKAAGDSSFVTSSGGCRVPHVPAPVVTDFRLCGSLTPHTIKLVK